MGGNRDIRVRFQVFKFFEGDWGENLNGRFDALDKVVHSGASAAGSGTPRRGCCTT